MKRLLQCVPAALLVLFGFALPTASAYAQEEGQTFVYTNNNNAGSNTVSAFSVLPGGALMPVPGSPFATLGTGQLGFVASHRITATVRRNLLFVANSGSNNISVFKIDTDTGALTLVAAPFSTGGSAGTFGISLAATPNGRYLYAANGGSGNISAFGIASNGTLTSIGSTLVEPRLDGSKVSPNGKFLGVALQLSDRVAMFRIASNGALTAAPGSPFSAAGGAGGAAADVEINCKSNLLFDPQNSFMTTVAVFTIASNGALAQITGSPFNLASGSNSNAGVLSPDNRHLLISNQFSNTLTSLDVASGGSLTVETDSPSGPSPFANPGGVTPLSLGTNREGKLLYASNSNGVVTGFHIDSDGGLSQVTGSPFPTGGTGSRPSLTVFPAHEDEGGGDEVDHSGRKGHFEFEADHACTDSGEMHFKEDSGHEMDGKVRAVSATRNTATISGTGTLADGTPVTYTAVVLGNMPVIGANQFAISWITATGSVFQTSGALTNGYIAVHP